VTLATVNVGVTGEDISDRLRSQVVGEREGHDGRVESRLGIGSDLIRQEEEKSGRAKGGAPGG